MGSLVGFVGRNYRIVNVTALGDPLTAFLLGFTDCSIMDQDENSARKLELRLLIRPTAHVISPVVASNIYVWLEKPLASTRKARSTLCLHHFSFASYQQRETASHIVAQIEIQTLHKIDLVCRTTSESREAI